MVDLVCYNSSMYTKHTKERVAEAVANSFSYAQTLKYLGIRDTGGNRQNLKHNIAKYELSVSHFTGQGHGKGKPAINRRPPDEVLVCLPEGSRRVSASRLRKAMISLGILYICNGCSIGPNWNGKPLTLQVDHINGNNIDCRVENLRFMCPNCHSQEETSTSPWRFTTTKDNKTCECGKPKLARSTRCKVCYNDNRPKKN